MACQFLNVRPTTIEVNPYLADLIEAKLEVYDADQLASDVGTVVRRAYQLHGQQAFPYTLPKSFVEPGVNGRWIFDAPVADQILALLLAIDELAVESHRRLFRVLLGGTLVAASNVVVNGKGRRYRGGTTATRHATKPTATELFVNSTRDAILDIHRYRRRACTSFDVLRGDCVSMLDTEIPCELAVFSPPYPNSFDYTDVYNVELWTLGYLRDRGANRTLRQATLSSHVQIDRAFSSAPAGSATLKRVLDDLRISAERLWDRRIPAMIGAYFADLTTVLDRLRKSIVPGGQIWTVLGDSQYVGVRVEAAAILAELAPTAGWRVLRVEPCRSMRSSPQQGGRRDLGETLLVLD